MNLLPEVTAVLERLPLDAEAARSEQEHLETILYEHLKGNGHPASLLPQMQRLGKEYIPEAQAFLQRAVIGALVDWRQAGYHLHDEGVAASEFYVLEPFLAPTTFPYGEGAIEETCAEMGWRIRTYDATDMLRIEGNRDRAKELLAAGVRSLSAQRMRSVSLIRAYLAPLSKAIEPETKRHLAYGHNSFPFLR